MLRGDLAGRAPIKPVYKGVCLGFEVPALPVFRVSRKSVLPN